MRGAAVMAWTGIAVGAVLRIARVLDDPSLWFDEAALAVNLLGRDYPDLLSGLWYAQAAPPLFAWVAKAVATLTGGSEFSLRLTALASGIAVLPLVWLAGRRLFTDEVAALAVWLLAISPLAIAYSAETKPYMSDALITAALLVAAASARDAGRQGSPASRLVLGGMAVGFLAILAAFPAPFMLAAGGTVLALAAVQERDWPRFRVWCATGVVWLVVFVVVFRQFFQLDGETAAYMRNYWASHLLQPGDQFRFAAAGAVESFLAPLALPSPLFQSHLALPAVALGGWIVWRRWGWVPLALIAGPLVVLLLASVAGHYPVAPRLVLFAAPLVVLGFAAAVVGAATPLAPDSPPLRSVLWLLLVGGLVLFGWESAQARAQVGVPRTARTAVEWIHARPTEAPIVLVGSTGAVWAYYTTDWSAPDRSRLEWLARQEARVRRPGDHAPPGSGLTMTVLPERRPAGAGRVELVAGPSGYGYRPGEGRVSAVYPWWGDATAAALWARRETEFVVYFGRASPDVARALDVAWKRLGGTSTKGPGIPQEVILVLGRVAPRQADDRPR